MRFSFSGGEVFFGNKADDLESLKVQYPNLHFQSIKQNHGDYILDFDDPHHDANLFADASIVTKKKFALMIQTADCLPIFLCDIKLGRISGVHAGWKGVHNQITKKTLLKMLSKGSQAKDIFIWIGPHIQKQSFEVGEDVFHLFDKKVQIQKESKKYIDLQASVLNQISEALNSTSEELLSKIHCANKDTFTDTDYFSFRRGKDKSRNLSFIYLF